MLTNKDYSKMTVEELTQEEAKIKSQKTAIAFLMAVLVGIAVYAATHKGFLVTIILLGAALLIGNRHSKSLRTIRAELDRRGQL